MLNTENKTQTGLLPIHVIDHEPVIDSRIMAESLQNQHLSLTRLIKKHQKPLNDHFGAVRFKIEPLKPGQKGGDTQKYYELNEEQATFILTLMQNTEKVVEFKALLTKSFIHYRNVSLGLVQPEAQKQLPMGTTETVTSAILLMGGIKQLADRIGVSHHTIKKLSIGNLEVRTNTVKRILKDCHTLLSNNAPKDYDNLDLVMQVDDKDLRMNLYQAMKKGGLL